jgi:hypothetical protein
MENKSFSENISGIKDNLRLYVEKKISLYALMAFEKSVKALTVFISNSVVILFMAMAVFLMSLAVALYIGRIMESFELGLLIVAGFYLFLGIVFLIFKRQIFSRFIITFLVSLFFNDDDDELPADLHKSQNS